ncbi:MAG: EAL domain-containing protein [Spirochaetaceae bacterium]|nr:EAL domain-containing protein [Spirochaetaceae bacterium]
MDQKVTAVSDSPLASAGLTSIDALLETARQQLDMDVAFVAEFVGDTRVMRHITANCPIVTRPGDSEPLEGTYCKKIVDGKLPNVIPDSAANAVAAAIPATVDARIAAYVGVPVVFRNGRVFGTLCCLQRTPNPELSHRDAAVLTVIAKAVSELLEEEERHRVNEDRVRARVSDLVAAGGPDIVYQPIVDTTSRRWAGLEALSRFPRGSGLSTEEWYRGAAAVGAELDLELVAARSAVGALDHVDGYLSLNLSAATVCTPEGQAFLAEQPLHRIVVELTEHAEVVDYPMLLSVLAPLRADGLRIAVDDTGAGFASLRHVLRLGADIIKLDRSLISGLEHDPVRHALVGALTRFAAETGSRVVAEGVETEGELAAVQGLGVQCVQGYLLGRPAPLTELLTLVPSQQTPIHASQVR